MKTILFLTYIVALVAASVIGATKYKHVDTPVRIVIISVFIQLATDLLIFVTGELQKYDLRTGIMNVYILINMYIITLFFILAVHPRQYKKLMVFSFLLWPCLAAVNSLFFQPLNSLQSNFLLVESFSAITMCLYFIYWLLKKDIVQNIFAYPHFRIAILWLLVWSATFFFWATIKILYQNHWQHTETLMHIHELINIAGCIGIGTTVLLYPKKAAVENL